MEDGRIEFLRLQVESHLVESVLKGLEGIEIESLTVRNVLETRFDSCRHTTVRFDVAGLTQLEIFAKADCRAAIMERIRELRNLHDAEVTCQCGRMCMASALPAQDRGFLRIDALGFTSADGSMPCTGIPGKFDQGEAAKRTR